jgi:hypothetical protein
MRLRDELVQRSLPVPVIFLGAGASAQFGFPPTKSFIKGLKERIPETPTNEEGKLLQSILEIKTVEDVEHVIQILDFFQGAAQRLVKN